MANYILYFQSLQALSIVLDNALCLSQISNSIRSEKSRVVDNPNENKEAFLESLLLISKLNDKENQLLEEIKKKLAVSIKNSLNFILSCDDKDFSDSSVTGVQNHLQQILDIMSLYEFDPSNMEIDSGLFEQVIDKLSSYHGMPQVDNIRNKVQKIRDVVLKCG